MVHKTDMAVVTGSPSSALMTLVDYHHMSDFNEVVEFLKTHLDDIINEVHGFDKLLLDDGKVQINCPPVPEAGDSHGNLLLRTLSEKEGRFGITLKREFKVHDMGVDPDNADHHKVEIREDVVQAPETEGPPIMKENVIVVSFHRKPTK